MAHNVCSHAVHSRFHLIRSLDSNSLLLGDAILQLATISFPQINSIMCSDPCDTAPPNADGKVKNEWYTPGKCTFRILPRDRGHMTSAAKTFSKKGLYCRKIEDEVTYDSSQRTMQGEHLDWKIYLCMRFEMDMYT